MFRHICPLKGKSLLNKHINLLAGIRTRYVCNQTLDNIMYFVSSKKVVWGVPIPWNMVYELIHKMTLD